MKDGKIKQLCPVSPGWRALFLQFDGEHYDFEELQSPVVGLFKYDADGEYEPVFLINDPAEGATAALCEPSLAEFANRKFIGMLAPGEERQTTYPPEGEFVKDLKRQMSKKGK